jgi:hypothetical protein
MYTGTHESPTSKLDCYAGLRIALYGVSITSRGTQSFQPAVFQSGAVS